MGIGVVGNLNSTSVVDTNDLVAALAIRYELPSLVLKAIVRVQDKLVSFLWVGVSITVQRQVWGSSNSNLEDLARIGEQVLLSETLITILALPSKALIATKLVLAAKALVATEMALISPSLLSLLSKAWLAYSLLTKTLMVYSLLSPTLLAGSLLSPTLLSYSLLSYSLLSPTLLAGSLLSPTLLSYSLLSYSLLSYSLLSEALLSEALLSIALLSYPLLPPPLLSRSLLSPPLLSLALSPAHGYFDKIMNKLQNILSQKLISQILLSNLYPQHPLFHKYSPAISNIHGIYHECLKRIELNQQLHYLSDDPDWHTFQSNKIIQCPNRPIYTYISNEFYFLFDHCRIQNEQN